MCIHLQKAEDYIKASGLRESWPGQAWSLNCREWIYFNCSFSPAKLIEKPGPEDCVTIHDYYDIKVGAELGLFCESCKDGIMSIHARDGIASSKPTIIR